MVAVAPGDALSVSRPYLDAVAAGGGVLADPYALAFQVFDLRDDSVAPAQVYPTTPGNRQSVDLTNDKIALGHFAARWTVPSNLATGRYEIRWFLVQTQGAAERSWRVEFEVLPQVPFGGLSTYALVVDVRDEGVGSDVKNRRIIDALVRASELIQRWTGRTFGAVYKAIKVDGLSRPVLPLEEPICAIEGIRYDMDTADLETTDYVVYNRHISEGLITPDDRDDPKIVFTRRQFRGVIADIFPTYPLIASFNDLRAPRLTPAQELTIRGVFGYTDPDPAGSPVGVVPSPIRRAAVLLALRDLPLAASQPDQAFDARYAHRVKSQRTREQSIEWNDRKLQEGAAPFTGDPAIDDLLMAYVRPLTGTGV